jgi:cell wall-associated NlpC family hydrolase
MTRRQIFLWVGLIVLFSVLVIPPECLADSKYRVRSGSNLYAIAKKHGVSVDAIRQTNNLSSDRLKPGQVLIIPSKKAQGAPATAAKASRQASTRKAAAKSQAYTVRSGDTLSGIAKKTGLSVAQLKKINHLRGSALKPGQKILLARTVPKAHDADRDETRSRDLAVHDEEEMDDEDGVDTGGAQEDTATIERDMVSSAELLGNWKDPDEQRLFVKVVKGFLGAPYRLGGSTVRGIDCSGFVAKIYQFFDVNLPRTAREQSRVGMTVDRDNLDIGDLVFFNTRRAFGHVGIYIGNNQFIHAAAGRKREVSINNLDDPYYSKRFVKAVRLKGKEKEQAKTGNGSG